MQKTKKYFLVGTWFLLNVFVSLYPPLYWAAGKHNELVLGLPASFIYFMVVSISITLSILYAYRQDNANGELSS
jgi:hypothetical protein